MQRFSRNQHEPRGTQRQKKKNNFAKELQKSFSSFSLFKNVYFLVKDIFTEKKNREERFHAFVHSQMTAISVAEMIQS